MNRRVSSLAGQRLLRARPFGDFNLHSGPQVIFHREMLPKINGQKLSNS
jgi:hypothetical protein